MPDDGVSVENVNGAESTGQSSGGEGPVLRAPPVQFGTCVGRAICARGLDVHVVRGLMEYVPCVGLETTFGEEDYNKGLRKPDNINKLCRRVQSAEVDIIIMHEFNTANNVHVCISLLDRQLE